MFSKSTVFAAAMALGLLVRSCSASNPPPPACLITCLGEKGGSLNDLDRLCTSSGFPECFSRLCGSEAEDAKEIYKETCKTAGYDIALVVPPSSANTTDNMESFPSITGDPNATPTASGSSSPISTSGASPSLVGTIPGYAFALIVAAVGMAL